jgi:transcriptional antiterminator RfaH
MTLGYNQLDPALSRSSTFPLTVAQSGFSQFGAWFCIQTNPKHEHIAAAWLKQDPHVDVFLPRIRYQRSTQLGRAWVTEALFTNYLFARFDFAARLRWVQASRGVRNVVHFGDRWPTIPDSVIADLQAALGAEEIKFLSRDFCPGDSVEIRHGVFHGLQAVVTHVIPARKRVAILLDFLGRQTALELDRDQLTPNREIRMEPEMALVRQDPVSH